MKKLFLITVLVLLTLAVSAQKKSNYEKYWQAREDSIKKSQVVVTDKQTIEFDDLYYQPSKDVKKIKRDYVKEVVDTLVEENPSIEINYIYNNDPFFYSNRIGRFYYGGFNHWYYNNPYFYNSWLYDDIYFGWNYPYFGTYYSWNYPYFGWNRPYYMHNNYNQHNNFYGHNQRSMQNSQYSRRERPSNLTDNNRRVQPLESREVIPQQRTNPQDKSMYQQNRRSYTPSYENPRMTTKPQFNNSRTTDMNRGRNMNNMDMNKNMNNMGNRSTNMNNMGNRRTETSTQSRTYVQPSISYSPPPQMNRSSEPQGFGRTFNFNSGVSNNRSSGINSSSGSNSSGSNSGRSSGSSTSTGRR